MKIAILDDYFDTVRGLPSFTKLEGHDVKVWTDHVQDDDVLAERLKDVEVLVLASAPRYPARCWRDCRT
jgi:D-3-phosphoglycerate dehydrogenase